MFHNCKMKILINDTEILLKMSFPNDIVRIIDDQREKGDTLYETIRFGFWKRKKNRAGISHSGDCFRRHGIIFCREFQPAGDFYFCSVYLYGRRHRCISETLSLPALREKDPERRACEKNLPELQKKPDNWKTGKTLGKTPDLDIFWIANTISYI